MKKFERSKIYAMFIITLFWSPFFMLFSEWFKIMKNLLIVMLLLYLCTFVIQVYLKSIKVELFEDEIHVTTLRKTRKYKIHDQTTFEFYQGEYYFFIPAMLFLGVRPLYMYIDGKEINCSYLGKRKFLQLKRTMLSCYGEQHLTTDANDYTFF